MILRLKYQFWHKNTNNYLDFQEFIEKVTKTAVFGIMDYFTLWVGLWVGLPYHKLLCSNFLACSRICEQHRFLEHFLVVP